jgi:hypothetical protein
VLNGPEAIQRGCDGVRLPVADRRGETSFVGFALQARLVAARAGVVSSLASAKDLVMSSEKEALGHVSCAPSALGGLLTGCKTDAGISFCLGTTRWRREEESPTDGPGGGRTFDAVWLPICGVNHGAGAE